MISWKYSFETVRRELDLVRKKKQALDGLLNKDRISQPTYNYLNKDLTEAITRIENDQKTFADRITSRATQLEGQIKSLEMFLANIEIHHAAGEIDDEVYRHQGKAISLGIDATKRELGDIKGVLINLIPESAPNPPSPPPTPVEEDVTPETPTEEPAEVEESETEEMAVEASPE